MPAKSKAPKEESQVVKDGLFEQSLPQDRRDACDPESSWVSSDLVLRDDLLEELAKLNKRTGHSTADVIVGALVTLFHFYNREDHAGLGWIRDARGTQPDSIIPLSVVLSNETSFAEILLQISKIVKDGEAQSDTLENGFSFPVIVRTTTEKNTDSKLTHPKTNDHQESCELLIDAQAILESRQLKFGFNAQRFRADFISDFMEQFQRVIFEAITDPLKKLNDYVLISPESKNRLLGWGNVKDHGTSITNDYFNFFLHHVSKTPDKIALKFHNGSLSYQELAVLIQKQVRHFQNLEVGKGKTVAICLPRSPELVISVFSTLGARAAVFLLDPDLPQARQLQLLDLVSPTVLVTTEHDRSSLESSKWNIFSPEDILAGVESFQEFESISTHPEDVTFMLPTSGSTGTPKLAIEPKGVIFGDIPNRGSNYLLKNGSGTAFMRSEVVRSMANGGTLHILPPEIENDLLKLIEFLDSENIEDLLATPSMLRGIMNTGAKCRSIKLIDCIGEAISIHDMEKFQGYFGAQIRYGYGCTEAAGATSVTIPPDQAVPEIAHMGRPHSNRRIYILDPTMNLCPTGMPGEIYVGGCISLGYLGSQREEKERYLRDPFDSSLGGRMFKTGDRGRWVGDGNFEVLGRIDNQFKLRGYRIEPGEIEFVINEHPDVISSAVVLREDRPDDQQMVAYYEVRPGKIISTSTLRSYLRERLPDYMVPSIFVHLDALPITSNGKISHKSLPQPTEADRRNDYNYVAPRTHAEEQLAEIWKEVFGFEQVSVQDDFFDLGGHSLLATRLATRIEEVWHRKFPSATLFQSPTIESLAKRLTDDHWSPSWSSLVPLETEGNQPPLFFIHGWGGTVFGFVDLAKLLPTDQPSYGIQALGLDGESQPHPTVEDMAAHYIDEITTFQPTGAIYLAGYSLGGMIAFEIARQLKQKGRKVAMLALLDTAPMGILPWRWYFSKIAFYLPRRFGVHFHAWREMPLQQRLPYLRGRLVALRHRLRRSGPRKSESLVPTPLTDQHEKEASFGDYFSETVSAYRPRPFDGCGDVFVCEDESYGIRPFWRSMLQNGVSFHKVPGDHFQIMFSSEHRTKLAEALTAALLSAQSKENENQETHSPS